MNQKKINGARLYNVMFPVWFLLVFPIAWLVVLPVNFLIDSLVILLALKVLRFGRGEMFAVWKKCILLVWLFGFGADIAGAALLFLTQLIPGGGWWYDFIVGPVAFNPFDNPFALGFVLLITAVSGFLIYVFNVKAALRRTSLNGSQKRVTALLLALLTAPYLFLLPSQLFYSPEAPFYSFTNHIVDSNHYQAQVIDEQGNERVPGRSAAQLLREAVNTARRVAGAPGGNETYTVRFQDRFTGEYPDIETRFELSESGVFVEWAGRRYQVRDEFAGKIRELIRSSSARVPTGNFMVVDPPAGSSLSDEPVYLWTDGDAVRYAVAGLDPDEATLIFEDGTRLTIREALRLGWATVGDLAEKGLSITVEAQPVS